MSPVADNEFASGFTKTRKVSPNTHSQPQSPAVSTSTTHSSRPANANRSSMRPLEPSNVKADRRVSGLNFNNHDKTDKVDKRDERETSTARKVMDFFKRRSMRIWSWRSCDQFNSDFYRMVHYYVMLTIFLSFSIHFNLFSVRFFCTSGIQSIVN